MTRHVFTRKKLCGRETNCGSISKQRNNQNNPFMLVETIGHTLLQNLGVELVPGGIYQ
jgi:hypothetical protein